MGSIGVSSRGSIGASNSKLTAINKTAFTDDGGGMWSLDIDGVGGVQILDEQDSTRAGFGSGPAYGVKAWNDNGEVTLDTITYGSLNGAKSMAKEALRDILTTGK